MMREVMLFIRTSILRSKVSVGFAVLCAVVLCLIMNLMSNVTSEEAIGHTRIGLIDNDATALSEDFRSYLSDKLNIELVENLSYDALSKKLIDKDISVIVEVPHGFEASAASDRPSNLNITSLDDYENSAFITAYMNSYMNSIQILSDGAGGDRQLFKRLLTEYQAASIPIARSALPVDSAASGQESGFIQGMGFFLLFGFTYGLFIAFMVFDDKATGIFRRVQATPVKSVQYILGTTLFGVLNGLITIGIFSAYLKVTGFKIGIPLGTVIFFMFLMILLQIVFSMMIALFLNSKTAVMTIIIGYGAIANILGGAYFPVNMTPDSFQKIARTTPHFWFMDALRRLQENPSANVVPNIIILVLFIVLMYLISAFQFTQRKSS